MAKQIGPYTFSQWRLAIPRTSYAMAAIPGAPGYAGRIVISDAKQKPLARGSTAIQTAGNGATAALLMNQYYALKDARQPLTIVDQFGLAFFNCLILDVVCEPSELIGGLCRVDCNWVIDVPPT